MEFTSSFHCCPYSATESCYRLSCPPLNLYIEALVPKVIVFGDGPWKVIRFRGVYEGMLELFLLEEE
jgi:hypothetical protein